MRKQVAIAVIGKGKLGSTLARAIRNSKQYSLHSHLAARSASFKSLRADGGPDVLFIVTKDDMIPTVSKKAGKACGKNLRLMVHFSGATAPHNLHLLTGVNLLTLHPIQTFTSDDTAKLAGIYWAASTSSEQAKKFAKAFVKELGGKAVIDVDWKDLVLYHLITVFAANFPVLLGGAIEKLSKKIGKNPSEMKKAVGPLMEQAVRNVLSGDAKNVLTGPFARNDVRTIVKHRKALNKMPPSFLKIYDAFHTLARQL